MSDDATNDESTEATDAVSETEAVDTNTEATAADESTEADASTDAPAEAITSYTLPEDHETQSDEDLRSLFESLDADIEAAKALAKSDPTVVSFTDVALAEQRREAQKTIEATLVKREAEAKEKADRIKALDEDVPTLPKVKAAAKKTEAPTAKAAAAAPAADVKEAIVAAAADRDTPIQPQETVVPARHSIVAAAAEVATRWVNQSDYGESYNLGEMINGSRPAPGGADGIEARPRESVMASVRINDRDEARELTDSASHNERVIAAAIDEHREARRSAGDGNAKLAAICDPATILRDAMVCGTDATPFQSSLVGLSAQSGNALKFQYRLPTSITEASAGVGEWSPTNQAAIDRTVPSTWKPCVSIACPSYDTQSASEITACYEIDAFTELSSPEAEADFAFAKDRAFARFSEGWYLRKVDTFLYNLSFNGFTGAVPDAIEAVLTAISSGDYGERLTPGDYSVYGSPGILPALVIDENRKAYRAGPTAAYEDVQQIVEDATKTSYVQLLDLELNTNSSLKSSPFGTLGSVGGASATPSPKLYSTTFTLRILDPSAFVNFTTGEAVFGEQITHDQARRNQRGFFQRVFGGLMKPGCTPGYKVTITLCTDGSRGGFVDPGCTPTQWNAGTAFQATPAG